MLIGLRPTGPADIDFVLQVEHDPAHKPFIGQWSADQHLAALTDRDLGHFIAEQMNDRQPVGYLILAGLQKPDENIEFRRIVITRKGLGYGRAALRLVKKLVFEDYHAHRLWLDVKDHNQRAQQLYQSEGFLVEHSGNV
jgi:diamine N-acetyltransferase